MGGGAAVLAAMGAIAELELPLSVIGVLPACENMIGPDAVRPSDVIQTAAGLTVEVTNPDAEGRLILADALWYAQHPGRDAPRRPRDADRRDAGRDGRPLRRGLRQRRDLARSRSSTPAMPPATSRGPGRCTRATASCSSRASPTCATPPGGRTGIRSRPRRSSSTSPAGDVGARRHARAGAPRRRSRRRDREGSERLRRRHARRARLAPGRHAPRQTGRDTDGRVHTPARGRRLTAVR